MSNIDTNAASAATPPQTIKSASYAKMRSGDWGIRLSGFITVTEGDEVEITQKDGQKKRERIGHIVWCGSDDSGVPITLAAKFGAPKPKPKKAASKTAEGLRASSDTTHSRRATDAENAALDEMFKAL